MIEETFDDTGERLNYDNWIPNEQDRLGILADFKSSYDAAVEVCGGVDCEEALEAKEMYKRVLKGTLSENKSLIQEYYAEMYLAVNGQLHKYYMEDELISRIQRFVM